MKFETLLEYAGKHYRKTLMSGRKHKLPINPRLEIPIIGPTDDPHAKVNRDRRYRRRAERLGEF